MEPKLTGDQQGSEMKLDMNENIKEELQAQIESALAQQELIIRTILLLQRAGSAQANPPFTEESWQQYEADLRKNFQTKVGVAVHQRYAERQGSPGYYSSDPEISRLTSILEALGILQSGTIRLDLTLLKEKIAIVAQEIGASTLRTEETIVEQIPNNTPGESLDSARL